MIEVSEEFARCWWTLFRFEPTTVLQAIVLLVSVCVKAKPLLSPVYCFPCLLFPMSIVSPVYCFSYLLFFLSTVSPVYCFPCLLFPRYSVSPVYCFSCLLFPRYSVSPVYCFPYLLFPLSTVSPVYCFSCLLSLIHMCYIIIKACTLCPLVYMFSKDTWKLDHGKDKMCLCLCSKNCCSV